jgi:hypothetical protein
MRKGEIAPGLRRPIGGVGSFSLFYKIDRIHSFDIRYSTFCGSAVRFLFLSFVIPNHCQSTGIRTFLLSRFLKIRCPLSLP